MATDPDRITTPERQPEDADLALRPKTLDEFIGQQGADLPRLQRREASSDGSGGRRRTSESANKL